MILSNRQKAKHGRSAQESLSKFLDHCKEKNYIQDYKEGYKTGKPGFINQKQFSAPFLITFNTGEKWILFCTTSVRSDRIKGQQWDAFNIKRDVPSIKKAYIVIYPERDASSDYNAAENITQGIVNGATYSAIDGVIAEPTLHSFIEQVAMSTLSRGQVTDLQGRNFEDLIAMILSNKDNLTKYLTNDKTITGMHYSYFHDIISSLKINPLPIKYIEATADKKKIGRLPSGGAPKTDVLVTIYTTNNLYQTITISCKRSSKDSVSVHEYSADSFSAVLDPNNQSLKKLLCEFQDNPSLSAFGAENIHHLTVALEPYLNKLTKWVLAGIGGAGNPEIQWATHILTYDNNNDHISFHTVAEYIDSLKLNHIEGHFGTFFTWTYPSKQRGRRIQLKCKIM